jgi:alkaline phosphatase
MLRPWLFRVLLAGVFCSGVAVACHDGVSSHVEAPIYVGTRAPPFGVDARGDDAGFDAGEAGLVGDGASPDLVRSAPRPPFARNVILFIGDGMGFHQVEAARRFLNGNTAPLVMETLPTKSKMWTLNASGGITDSAAGATAFATGRKVSNEVLSLAIPGDGGAVPTALELRKTLGAATGLVTRETPVVDATPAAFAAHQSSRYSYAQIANDILNKTKPDFIAGQATFDADNRAAVAAGYKAVQFPWDSVAAANWLPGTTKVSWLYDQEPPPLSEVTKAALELLSRSPVGFFLMVENEGTDTAGHAHDLKHVVESVLELDRAVAAAVAWMGTRADTLIIVTADHETGALTLADEPPIAGVLPRHTFGDSWHTGWAVPIFATGIGAAQFPSEIQNNELFRWLAP